LYEQFDFDLPLWDSSHQPLVQQHLTIFICPTDPEADRDFVELGQPVQERYASASYVACFGSPDLDLTPDKSDGVFSRNSSTRVRDVVDGLSHTFFVGERVNGVRFLKPGATVRSAGRASLSAPAAVPFAGGPLPRHTAGGSDHIHFETIWAGAVRDPSDPEDDHGHLTLFHTAHTPNSPQTDDRDITAPHSQVAQFLMGDGSVQGIPVSIDLKVYQALGTRAGGETNDQF